MPARNRKDAAKQGKIRGFQEGDIIGVKKAGRGNTGPEWLQGTILSVAPGGFYDYEVEYVNPRSRSHLSCQNGRPFATAAAPRASRRPVSGWFRGWFSACRPYLAKPHGGALRLGVVGAPTRAASGRARAGGRAAGSHILPVTGPVLYCTVLYCTALHVYSTGTV